MHIYSPCFLPTGLLRNSIKQYSCNYTAGPKTVQKCIFDNKRIKKMGDKEDE